MAITQHTNTPDQQALAERAKAELATNPDYQNWVAMNKNQRGIRTAPLSQFGITYLPDFVVNQGGGIGSASNHGMGPWDWIIPAAAIGGGIGLSAAAGPAAATTTGAGGAAVGTGAGAAGGAGAAAGGGGAVADVAGNAAKTKALAGLGLSGSDIASIIAILGGDTISALSAVRPQQRQSFSGTDLDPTKLGGSIKGMLDQYLGETEDRAHSDSTIDTTVNPLPTFRGGGLPMMISAPGQDARRLARRTLPTGSPTTITRDPNTPPGTKTPVTTDHTSDPLNGSGFLDPSKTQGGISTDDGQRVSGGGSDQALAAITLLRKAGLQF